MKILDVDPRKAVVIVEFADGKEYTYTMADLAQEEHGPVLATAMAHVTLDLETCKTKFKVWQAQQFIYLRKQQPSFDGKTPKKMTEKDVDAAMKTSDGFTSMRNDLGRATACANMLEVMASLVSGGRFIRKDRPHAVASVRS